MQNQKSKMCETLVNRFPLFKFLIRNQADHALNLIVFDGSGTIYINGIQPSNLDNYIKKLEPRYKILKQTVGLERRYPHFIAYISPDPKTSNLPKPSPQTCSFWVKRNSGGCGSSLGTQELYPPSRELIKKLDELHAKVENMVRGDEFFCTKCGDVKPIGEFGAYHFTNTQCKTCATPEFIHLARSETYN